MREIRPEAPADFGAIRAVHLQAFPTPLEADLVEALRDTADHVPELCLVAVEDGVLAGHIAYSRARLAGGAEVLALAPMAVLPECQRRGLGSGLVRESLRLAAATAHPLVIVVGHPEYYPRFGFESAGELGLEAPFPVPAEAWMAFRLPAYDASAAGAVEYAAPLMA